MKKNKETVLQVVTREYHGWIREWGKPPDYFLLTKDHLKELRQNVQGTSGEDLGSDGTIWGVPIKIIPRQYIRRKDTKTFPLF